jgi:hypothetical protein
VLGELIHLAKHVGLYDNDDDDDDGDDNNDNHDNDDDNDVRDVGFAILA